VEVKREKEVYKKVKDNNRKGNDRSENECSHGGEL
jgi:hypothetical protein